MKRTWLVLVGLLVLGVPATQAQLSYRTANGSIYDYSKNPDGISCTITGYSGTNTDAIIPTNINGLAVTIIGEQAFELDNLTSVTIPYGVTDIESNAFQQCGPLNGVTIPDSVTNIGEGSFAMCLSLVSVTIGSNVTSIGSRAFFDCPFTTVTIPNSVTSIGDQAFMYCGLITDLVIGNSVITIGNGAFEYCDSLDSVTIPDSVTSIGSQAFASGDFLFSVFFAGNAPVNDGSAFSNDNMVTVFFLFGTCGWSSTYGGRPAVSCPTVLHEFGEPASDGEHPYAGLTPVGSKLFGTTGFGGSYGNGTIFAINTDGTGYTNLYSFGSVANDGVSPNGLALAGSTLYGTTGQGGSLGYGTIFAINTDGTGYNILHFFGSVANDGVAPLAGLTLVGSTLYGTTQSGFGSSGSGTIFAINTDGTGYTNIYLFGSVADDGVMTGSSAGLTLVGSKLYGTAAHGGYYGTNEYGYGTIFAINTDGTGYTNLYRFGAVSNDGVVPFGGHLTLVGSALYGTTYWGLGSSSNGAIFAINTDGTGYTNLHSFGSVSNDGANPQAGLTLAGSTLYGTTYIGGSLDAGAIFAINPDGTGYTLLASCAGLNAFGGAYENGLVLAGSTLYGTTSCGGFGDGTIFSLTTNTVQMAIVTTQASPATGGTASGGGTFAMGSSITVTANANDGFTFSNWTENGTAVSLASSYTFALGSNLDLVANFTPVNYTIAVSALPTGGGTVSGGGTFGWGSLHTVTAKSNGGYRFSDWTENGTVVSLTPSYTFTVSTNESLVAIFAVKGKPNLTISSPKSGQNVSNALLLINGAVTDIVIVDDVYYQLNGGNWTLATHGNSWKNWTASVTLIPGTNTISAYAQDASGSVSPTKTVKVQFIPSATLIVQTSGNGAFTPKDNGALLAIGTNYTLAASPGRNWSFSNWVARGSESFVFTNPVLKFNMRSNLVLEANFVPNPFILEQGTFNGLFLDTNEVMEASSGFFTLKLGTNGAFTGKIMTSASTYTVPTTTKFDVGGQVEFTTPTKRGALTFNLQLDTADPASQQITGTVSDGVWTAWLTADRAVFSASENKAAKYEGQYTVAIPGSDDGAASPGGFGCATLSISPAGLITMTGNMADGTAISQSVSVSKDGRWPFYASYASPPAGNGGAAFGWMTFSNQPVSALGGTMYWFRPAGKTPSVYQTGFSNTASVIGSVYNPADKPLLALTNGQVTLDGGDLPFPITNQITLTANDTIAIPHTAEDTNKLTLTITKATGAISGTFANPSNPTKTITVKCVLLQNQTNAVGYFLGNNQSGSILITQ